MTARSRISYAPYAVVPVALNEVRIIAPCREEKGRSALAIHVDTVEQTKNLFRLIADQIGERQHQALRKCCGDGS